MTVSLATTGMSSTIVLRCSSVGSTAPPHPQCLIIQGVLLGWLTRTLGAPNLVLFGTLSSMVGRLIWPERTTR